MPLIWRQRDRLARAMFFLSVPILAFGYGVVAAEFGWFPVPLMKEARATAGQLLEQTGFRLPWYYRRSERTQPVGARMDGSITPGLRLISGVERNGNTLARVVDVDGRVIHSWLIEWNEIWPDAEHLPDDVVPKAGHVLVHGMALAPNGDLIFNFDQRGLVRLDACGQVRWRLPYRTHHSVELDERGNIWAGGMITRTEPESRLPNYRVPFDDYTVLEVSSDGRILRELFVVDLLIENGLKGLLYMASTSDSTKVTGDTLHLNDVDVFPASLAPGRFLPGDVLISLRNINAIVVFDGSTRRIKYLSVGEVLRQHDTDFLDGNSISAFDNNNLSVRRSGWVRDPAGHHSRIVKLSALKGGVDVLFSGTPEQPFFTDIMGRQQMLPNGNILLAESVTGRVLEVDRAGRIVWEYFNVLGDGRIGLVDDALWLPAEFDQPFFDGIASPCPNALAD